jgi:predicted dehydrogenase
MLEKPIRIGLIGCGDISPAHLNSYKACGYEVAGLCDLIIERAEKRRREFCSPDTFITTDYHELLAMPDIDIITVATPVVGHAPITIDALRAGKNVACEKPSTLSLAENLAVIEEADNAGKKVIFFSSRFRWSEAELAKQFIQDGDLGDIYRVHVQFYRRRGRPGIDIIPDATWFIDSARAGGGVIMDMGQYFMDMVFNLVGWPKVTAASATTFRGFPFDLPEGTPFDVEEHCTFLARCENNLSVTFDMAWISNNPPTRTFIILGTKGGIRIDDSANSFTFYHDKGGPWKQMNTTSEWKDKTSSNDNIYKNLVKAIRGEDADLGTTPRQALAITELTQMVLKSAKENREIRREEIV